MRFTDVFIRRPILSVVVSFLILLLGARSIGEMQIREYPELTNAVITVTTVYPGADAALMQGLVTDVVQAAVARAEGVDYVSSSSRAGVSQVTAHILLNFDPGAAMTEIMSQVNAVRSQLPRDAQDPILAKSTGESVAALYISFSSDVLSVEQLSDYLSRVVRPKLTTVPGVGSVALQGEKKFALRVWLDPQKLAMHGLSAEQIRAVLASNNRLSAAGSIKGYYDEVAIRAATSVQGAKALKEMVIQTTDNGVVRLGDVADVTFSAEDDDFAVYHNGKPALFVSVDAAPEANVLEVAKAVKAELPGIENDLPSSIKMALTYDATDYIRESISEVMKTIVEAAVIVIVVIFLFMGSLRSVVIPVVAIPLSLVGVSTLMLAMGFSINLLTLLAFVLAIGLVVDDAIVVVENVHRHIEDGKGPFAAALIGAREIAVPVISMTITLAAVYAPIAFLGGITGALFKEFALTLAGAVAVSGIVALTLSPMMCARLLRHESEGRMARFVDRLFTAISTRYEAMLKTSLKHPAAALVVAGAVLLTLPGMLYLSDAEMAPSEDKGLILNIFFGPVQANIDYMKGNAAALEEVLTSIPERREHFTIVGAPAANMGLGFLLLKDWSQRKRTEKAISAEVQKKVGEIAAFKATAFSIPPLPGGGGMPVEFVVSTVADYEALFAVMEEFQEKARKSGLFIYQDSNLKYERPEIEVVIDRELAGKYGVEMQAIGAALGTMFGGGEINRVDFDGKGYKVIPLVSREFRLDPHQIEELYVRSRGGEMIPLASLVKVTTRAKPVAANQHNQLNAATFSAAPMPGVSLGTALEHLQDLAEEILPQGFMVDYMGQSRQFMQEGSSLLTTFVFALIVIYLVLAAQYESFRDPLVILTSVPLSMAGALAPIALGLTTLNIYSQIGLITLVGLISKHGILICEVARVEQEERGKSRLDAVAHAAALRLRPILMTTAAMAAGIFPLIVAGGAGAASRHSIGLVVVTGLLVGTACTLLVLPVVYSFLAEDHQAKARRNKERDRVLVEDPDLAGCGRVRDWVRAGRR